MSYWELCSRQNCIEATLNLDNTTSSILPRKQNVQRDIHKDNANNIPENIQYCCCVFVKTKEKQFSKRFYILYILRNPSWHISPGQICALYNVLLQRASANGIHIK